MAVKAPPPAGIVPESKPNPDPSLLTTQQLIRELAGLKELFDARLLRLEDVRKAELEKVAVRFDGMDHALLLVRDLSDKMPAAVDEKIGSLAAVNNERFDSIQTQFRERDTRTEQSSKDSKVAVDAALQAAKEAVGKQQEASDKAILKQEAAFTKQIDQMRDLIQAGFKAVDDKMEAGFNAKGDQINDTKDRLTRVESEKRGAGEQVATTQAAHNTASLGTIAGLAAAVMAAASGAAGVTALLMKH